MLLQKKTKPVGIKILLLLAYVILSYQIKNYYHLS